MVVTYLQDIMDIKLRRRSSYEGFDCRHVPRDASSGEHRHGCPALAKLHGARVRYEMQRMNVQK
jgi:hypothetical protein